MASIFRKIASGTVVVGGIVFGGWALMNVLTPSKEAMMERLSIDPNENISANNKRNAQLFQTIQQNIQSPEPVWKVKPLEVHVGERQSAKKD